VWLQPSGTEAVTVGTTIQWFKTMTTNAYIRGVRDGGWAAFDRRLWQRDYYERIVRGEAALERIRAYIAANPAHCTAIRHSSSLGADTWVRPQLVAYPCLSLPILAYRRHRRHRGHTLPFGRTHVYAQCRASQRHAGRGIVDSRTDPFLCQILRQMTGCIAILISALEHRLKIFYQLLGCRPER
jgi:hypothetical protein